MSDINLFQIGGQAVRRTAEALEDTCAATMQCTASMLWRDHNSVAQQHSEHVLREAIVSFDHHDVKEATHQLVRELYFTSIFDSEAGSVNENAARAGLNCLKGGHSGERAEAVIKDVHEYSSDSIEWLLRKE